jgi:hypothetical protein
MVKEVEESSEKGDLAERHDAGMVLKVLSHSFAG